LPHDAQAKHAETFFAQVECETSAGLPDFVEDEFDVFLEYAF